MGGDSNTAIYRPAETPNLCYRFSCVGVLPWQGNPVCREVEYRFTVLAYIKNITYLDYGTIDPTEVLQVRTSVQRWSVPWRLAACGDEASTAISCFSCLRVYEGETLSLFAISRYKRLAGGRFFVSFSLQLWSTSPRWGAYAVYVDTPLLAGDNKSLN